jgi:hypothetical protein
MRGILPAAHLGLEVAHGEDGPCGDVGDAVGGAVDAHGPVLRVMAALVHHGYQLARTPAALYVPRHRVAAAQHLMLQDVQPCTASQRVPSGSQALACMQFAQADLCWARHASPEQS